MASVVPTPTSFPKCSPKDIAWAAGIIEGEGCIRLTKPKPRKGYIQNPTAFLRVKMCDKDIVQRFGSIWGFGSIVGPYWDGNPKHKPTWSYSANGHEKVQAILAAVWPWLGMRRKAKVMEVLADCTTLADKPLFS